MKKTAALVTGMAICTIIAASPAESRAGCEIKITASNSHPISSHWHDVILDKKDVTTPNSEVKIKMGLWKQMWNSDKKVPASTTRTFTYNADFSCQKKRRFHFHAKCYHGDGVGGKFVDFYYPSKTGWTERTNIDLGDVWMKHCE